MRDSYAHAPFASTSSYLDPELVEPYPRPAHFQPGPYKSYTSSLAGALGTSDSFHRNVLHHNSLQNYVPRSSASSAFHLETPTVRHSPSALELLAAVSSEANPIDPRRHTPPAESHEPVKVEPCAALPFPRYGSPELDESERTRKKPRYTPSPSNIPDEAQLLVPQSPSSATVSKTTQACGHCRARKGKCTGERPSCRVCLGRGFECHYSAIVRVRKTSVQQKRKATQSRSIKRSESDREEEDMLLPTIVDLELAPVKHTPKLTIKIPPKSKSCIPALPSGSISPTNYDDGSSNSSRSPSPLSLVTRSSTRSSNSSATAAEPKAYQACTKCRTRKVKCIGGPPCSFCIANGFECVYAAERRTRGPGRHKSTTTTPQSARRNSEPWALRRGSSRKSRKMSIV